MNTNSAQLRENNARSLAPDDARSSAVASASASAQRAESKWPNLLLGKAGQLFTHNSPQSRIFSIATGTNVPIKGEITEKKRNILNCAPILLNSSTSNHIISQFLAAQLLDCQAEKYDAENDENKCDVTILVASFSYFCSPSSSKSLHDVPPGIYAVKGRRIIG
ncbi:hypothetical protein TYRP_008971 [Tyrophagus putrescentiae]|nr:hypothetical protein TYRP_008971 [Tyrophagus putrescentiae]